MRDDLQTRPDLKSIARNDVALFLCNRYIDDIRTANKDPRLVDIPDLLDSYIRCVFRKAPAARGKDFDAQLADAKSREDYERKIEVLAEENFDSVSGDVRRRAIYVAHMARLAQLLELSGHLARENFFDFKRQEALDSQNNPHIKSAGVPGSIGRIFDVIDDEIGSGNLFTKADRKYFFRTPEEALHYLNTPVFEISLTQHPTNILTLPTIKLIREMHDAAREICTDPAHGYERLDTTIRHFTTEELTPVTDKDGVKKIINFTAEEELAFTLDTLEQIDNNLAGVYEPYEAALDQKFNTPENNGYPEQMRWDFFLDLRMKSWTMGDKDGNRNIKAEHLLLATLRHRQAAIAIALRHMDDMDKSGIRLDRLWRERLTAARARLHEIEPYLQSDENGDIALSQDHFDRVNKELAGALQEDGKGKGSDWEKFETDYRAALKAAGESAEGPQAQALLNAYRSMRTFGLYGARIELRDTAGLYKKIVDELLDDVYRSMKEEQKPIYLDLCMTSNPGYLKNMADAFLQPCDGLALRDYTEDPSDGVPHRALAYHTLKRLQVAASNPDLYQDSILAESDKPLHILVDLALQKMTTGANGEEAHHHIIPLFEEIRILRKAPSIIMEAFRFRSYRDHCLALAKGDLGKIRQKVQIAHSDNIRLGGTPAGRSDINRVHDVMRVSLQRFNGELEKLYHKDRHTGKLSLNIEFFEGMSLSHILRGGGKSLSAICNAFQIYKHTHITAQGADLQSYLGLSTSLNRLLTRFYVHSAKEIALREKTNVYGSNRRIEKAVSRACADCMGDYKDKHFGTETEPGPIGKLLALPNINYYIYSKTGNRGLRSASREGIVDQKSIVNPTKDTRAIGIAENMFDADLLPTWLGSENLRKNLSERLLHGSIYRTFELQVNTAINSSAVEQNVLPNDRPPLNANELKGLYISSPQFRDIIDQMACGLVASDVNRLQNRLLKAERPGDVKMDDTLRTYVEKVLPRDYANAGKLVLGAFGVPFDETRFDNLPFSEQTAYMRHMVENCAIPAYAEEYGVKRRFVTSSVLARDKILLEKETPNDEDLVTIGDLLAARMIASHGRVFEGEDIFYSSAKRQLLQRFEDCKQIAETVKKSPRDFSRRITRRMRPLRRNRASFP